MEHWQIVLWQIQHPWVCRFSNISGQLSAWSHLVEKVGAMDDTLLEKLALGGINTFSMNSGLTKDDLGWGSANFHKMVGRAPTL